MGLGPTAFVILVSDGDGDGANKFEEGDHVWLAFTKFTLRI